MSRLRIDSQKRLVKVVSLHRMHWKRCYRGVARHPALLSEQVALALSETATHHGVARHPALLSE